MGRSILTTGRIAEKPYRIRIIDRNVYTVEELCYSLAQCASFLDEDLMDHELLVWLEESCGLAELAAQLRSLLRGRCAVEDFVSVILLYVGYQSVAEIERIRASISSGKGMEPFQRRLSEAKFAASRGHITQAIELMDGILAELPELEREMRGRIWAEKGRLYAAGFRYAEAADCYGKAWRLSGSRQNCVRYLAALQFSIPEDAYAEYIGGHPELEEAAAQLTKAVAQADREWKNGTAGRQNRRLIGYLRNGQAKSFDNYAQQRIRELRDQFRADNAPSF
jgi:hypothetical protein